MLRDVTEVKRGETVGIFTASNHAQGSRKYWGFYETIAAQLWSLPDRAFPRQEAVSSAYGTNHATGSARPTGTPRYGPVGTIGIGIHVHNQHTAIAIEHRQGARR